VPCCWWAFRDAVLVSVRSSCKLVGPDLIIQERSDPLSHAPSFAKVPPWVNFLAMETILPIRQFRV
jgi:hypothetical protein